MSERCSSYPGVPKPWSARACVCRCGFGLSQWADVGWQRINGDMMGGQGSMGWQKDLCWEGWAKSGILEWWNEEGKRQSGREKWEKIYLAWEALGCKEGYRVGVLGSLPCHLTLNWDFEGGFPQTCPSCLVSFCAPVCCQCLPGLGERVALLVALEMSQTSLLQWQGECHSHLPVWGASEPACEDLGRKPCLIIKTDPLEQQNKCLKC